MVGYRIRSPPTLQHLCLQSIAYDIRVWCKTGEYDDFFKYKYILGPFDSLHTRQIHHLLDILSAKRLMRSHYLQFLLHHNITGVNLTCCSHLVTDTLIKVLMARCKKIAWLNLSDCTKLSCKTLVAIPANYPKLWSLSLQHISNCRDTVLEQLGQYCPQLKVLHVGRCGVTDKGIQGLCGTVDKPCCIKLTNVDISDTSITSIGVQLLLRTQPQLSYLSLHDVYLFKELDHGILPRTNLTSLDLSHLCISDDDFERIVEVSPSLVDVNISHCKELTNKSLDVCNSHLSELEHFQAGFMTSPNFNFHGILKILQKHGKTLRTLDISEMENVDIKYVILNCRSLEKFILDSTCTHASFVSLESFRRKWGSQVPPHSNEQLSLFDTNPEIRHLSLNSVQLEGDNQAIQFAAVLNNTSELQTLDLSFVEGLSDEVLDEFLASSNLASLEEVKLVGCEEISGNILMRVIEFCPSLKLLDVCSCKCVTRRDYDAMLKLVKSNGYELEIKWS